MTTLVDEGTEVADMEKLRVADRCDTGGCGAQAFVRTVLGDHDLDWCGHCFREHEAGLLSQGFLVLIDNRETINAKPGGSA